MLWGQGRGGGPGEFLAFLDSFEGPQGGGGGGKPSRGPAQSAAVPPQPGTSVLADCPVRATQRGAHFVVRKAPVTFRLCLSRPRGVSN